MPKYRVVLYYHGSATYEVEAENQTQAEEVARAMGEQEPEEAFRMERLILDYEDACADLDEEEVPDA